MNYCYIHLNREGSNYCSVCRRPICDKCNEVLNGICPRCSNALNEQVYKHNLNVLKWLIPLIIIRFTIYWDVVVCLFNKVDFSYFKYHLIILALLYIPLVLSIIWYGLKDGILINIIGWKNPHKFAERKRSKLISSYILGFLFFLVIGALGIFLSGISLICNIIHLIKNIKDIFKYKKLILTETAIRKLGD